MRKWLGILCLLSWAGCTGHPASPGSEALTVQLGAEPVSLDPALAEDGASIRVLWNTMDGLVGYDGQGRLQNRLAESYRASADGRKLTFKLRPGARWSDGRAVAAEDFVTGIARALAPSTGARLAGMLYPIRGARAYNSGKAGANELGVRAEGGDLVIELERPAPYFVQALILPVAMPERADILAAHGGRWPEDGPVTGAYRIAEHRADQEVRLERNPSYWGGAGHGPAIVRMLVVTDESTGLNLFEQGKLDIATKVPSTELPRMRKRGALHTDPFLATYYVGFNFRKPPFDDRDWRRAVAASIRRRDVVAALETGETPARSWVPKGIEGAMPFEDPASLYADSVAKVKPLAARQPEVTAAFDSGERNATVMQEIQHDLSQALGLKLALTNLDWKSYVKMLHSDAPPIFRFGFLAVFSDPVPHLRAFATGDPNNFLNWSNAEYDRLVAEVEAMKPGPAREAKARAAQEILLDREAIVVPIYHYVQNTLVSSSVTGFAVDPAGVIHFAELGKGR